MLPTRETSAADEGLTEATEIPDQLTEAQVAALYPQWHWTTPKSKFN